MIITVHPPNGASVTFHDCELLSTNMEAFQPYTGGAWLRFRGTNDMGREVVLCTSLPLEIYESITPKAIPRLCDR